MEPVYIEFVLRPMEYFPDRGNFKVDVHDADVFLNGSERLHTEPFTDNWQAPLSLRRLRNFCVVLFTVYDPADTDSCQCLIQKVKRVRTPHVLCGDELNSTS